MSEYDCRAGFGTHAHGRESSADAADSSFDLSVFAKDSLRMLLRLFWLPLLLAVVFSALFCYNAKRSYRPMYKASGNVYCQRCGHVRCKCFLLFQINCGAVCANLSVHTHKRRASQPYMRGSEA